MHSHTLCSISITLELYHDKLPLEIAKCRENLVELGTIALKKN